MLSSLLPSALIGVTCARPKSQARRGTGKAAKRTGDTAQAQRGSEQPWTHSRLANPSRSHHQKGGRGGSIQRLLFELHHRSRTTALDEFSNGKRHGMIVLGTVERGKNGFGKLGHPLLDQRL